jgi:hypothetical protein
VTLAVTGNTISGRVLRRQRMPMFEWHRCVDRKSIGHTVAELVVERGRLSVYFLYLAWHCYGKVL